MNLPYMTRRQMIERGIISSCEECRKPDHRGWCENCDAWTPPEPTLFRGTEALEAIRARLNGEYDHPALMKLGPLSTSILEDCYRILENTPKGAA
jgi:hypothetical protein